MNEQIELTIRMIISDLCDLDPKVILPTSNLSLELGLDSMDRIVLAQSIEEEFEIVVGDEESDRLRTVEELCEMVESKVGANK